MTASEKQERDLDEAMQALGKINTGNTIASQWIPISERTPPLRKSYRDPAPYVLVVDSHGRMSVAYADERSYGHGWVSAKSIGDVTHWMPLPDPPRRAA